MQVALQFKFESPVGQSADVISEVAWNIVKAGEKHRLHIVEVRLRVDSVVILLEANTEGGLGPNLYRQVALDLLGEAVRTGLIRGASRASYVDGTLIEVP